MPPHDQSIKGQPTRRTAWRTKCGLKGESEVQKRSKKCVGSLLGSDGQEGCSKRGRDKEVSQARIPRILSKERAGARALGQRQWRREVGLSSFSLSFISSSPAPQGSTMLSGGEHAQCIPRACRYQGSPARGLGGDDIQKAPWERSFLLPGREGPG